MVEFSLDKIRGLMAEKGLKQIDVADALSVSYATIQDITWMGFSIQFQR